MTEKSVKDYQVLGELSENTVHELQTPLASMKSKLEILLNSPLSEDQLQILSSMLDELYRLSSLNKSLVLLARLDHFNKTESPVIDFSEMVKDRLRSFEELFEVGEIILTKKIQQDICLHFNEDHAKLVIENLLSNALKHNVSAGFVDVELDSCGFTVTNSGPAPGFPAEELFQRFRRGSSSAHSLGIGLSLVKKIVEVYGHQIAYTYEGEKHQIHLKFKF